MKQQKTADEAQPIISWEEACTYEYFVRNRYIVPRFSYGKTQYEAICNNGFIKLYISKMRIYWIVQNEFGHQLRDWKFHVSVAHKDVMRAWNVLARLFVQSRCRGCMKVSYLQESRTPRGREITIYIYKFEDAYGDSHLAKEYELSLAQEHSDDFWISFFHQIEEAMEEHNIEPNGLADGDFKLGKYVSLRNESYVQSRLNTNELIYPPDEEGWNPNQQQLPFELQKLGVQGETAQGATLRTTLLVITTLLLFAML